MRGTVKSKSIKGYSLSKDYEQLWSIIKEGIRVPAWIVYSDEYEDPICDLVEVKRTPFSEYRIGSRGIGYEGINDGKEGFLSVCKQYGLEFIIPNIHDTKESKYCECRHNIPIDRVGQCTVCKKIKEPPFKGVEE